MKHFNYILFLLLIVIFSSPLKANKNLSFQEKEFGIEIVKCKKDTSFSYALYLPSYYTNEKKWPVLFALDPGARGQLPVKIFTDAAEKYGYIIIGSNDSQNGPWGPIFEAMNHLFEDAFQRYSIDSKRVYLTGFSGGSRAASAIAILSGRIAGVIGCGAGFAPNWPPKANLNFHYLGIIGNHDFNYLEMHQTISKLEKFKTINHLLVFDGGHQWPPNSITFYALEWLEVNAMKRKLIPYNEKFIQNIIEDRETQIKELKNKREYFKVYILYKQLVNYLDGLIDVTEYEKNITFLEQSDEIIEILKQKKRIENREAQMQKKYYDAFQQIKSTVFKHIEVETKTSAWWKNELNSINRLIDTSKNREEVLLGNRIVDFLWRTTYINYNTFMETKDYEQAKQFLEICEIANPKKPIINYLFARLYVQTNNHHKALSALEDAAKKGFSNIKLIEKDTIMNPLKRMKRYQKIIQEIESTKE